MRIIQIIVLTILLSSFSSINLMSQNKETTNVEKKEYLKGLTKASENDLSDKQIMFGGESIPVYNIKGERIRGMEMMETLMSGNYTPNYYMDKNKEIKVVVLRLLTEDEKAMQPKKNGKSIAVGADASDFTATDINGNEYSLNDLKGKIIVLNFWFVECKPCVMEMPELNELVKKHEGKDVVFLGFATNDVSRINSFLEKKEFSYKIIPNSRNIANNYNVSSYPTHIVIDQSSKITFLTSGLGPTTINDIEEAIEGLIKK